MKKWQAGTEGYTDTNEFTDAILLSYTSSYFAEQQQRGGRYVWLTAGRLQRWLKRNEVLETLLGVSGRMHVELLRHSANILSFLARRRALTGAHFSLLWQATQGRHENEKLVLYDRIVGVVPCLSSAGRSKLFSVLKGIPYSEVGCFRAM